MGRGTELEKVLMLREQERQEPSVRLEGFAAVRGGPSPAQVSTVGGPGCSIAAAPGLGVSFPATGRECECTWKLCMEPRTQWKVCVCVCVYKLQYSVQLGLLCASLDRVPDVGEGTFRFDLCLLTCCHQRSW